MSFHELLLCGEHGEFDEVFLIYSFWTCVICLSTQIPRLQYGQGSSLDEFNPATWHLAIHGLGNEQLVEAAAGITFTLN